MHEINANIRALPILAYLCIGSLFTPVLCLKNNYLSYIKNPAFLFPIELKSGSFKVNLLDCSSTSSSYVLSY